MQGKRSILAAAILAALACPAVRAAETGDIELGGEEARIRLTPLIWHEVRLKSGAKQTSGLLGLFHQTRLRSGELHSWHVFPYFQGPDYKVLFPLGYSVGPAGRKSQGVIPFFFRGPRKDGGTYEIAPLLLSGRWKDEDGSWSTWITPLYHHERAPDGSLERMHAATYFQGPDYKVLLPFGYSGGPPGFRHQGVIPFYFQGPIKDEAGVYGRGYYKFAPLLMSGWWKADDGARSLWITPLFHRTTEPDGRTRHMHVFNFFRVWREAEGRRELHTGAFPFYFQGPGYRVAPPVLSGWWRNPDGGTSLWITPLFHRTTEPDGRTRHMHAVNYYRVWKETEGRRELHTGVFPLYHRGPGYRVAPPLLSGWRRHADGSDSLWITPLFHRTREPDGSLRHRHVVTYFDGPGYKVFVPFGYSVGEPGRKHQAVIPFFLKGPDYWASPVALSGRWKGWDDSDSLWITPFFHRTREADGTLRHMHAFNYFEGPGYKLLLPFYYSVDRPDGKHRGIVPLVFWGPGYIVSPPVYPLGLILYPHGFDADWRRDETEGTGWTSPALLSRGRLQPDGRESLWVSPLFHRTKYGNEFRHMHALTFFRGHNYKVLFPFGYSVGQPGRRHQAVIPFYFGGPRYGLLPPLLSAWWRSRSGAETTWVSPLFHRTRGPDGELRHMHAFTYMRYRIGTSDKEHRALFPFVFWGPGYVKSPFLTTTVPGQAELARFRLKGSGYWLFPIIMCGWWRGADESRSLWLTPLFHAKTEKDGTFRSMHFLNYFQGRDYKVLFPLAYSAGQPYMRHQGLVPLFFRGPDYQVIPPLLAARWKRTDGTRSTWVAPVFHRTDGPDGGLRHMHALNYFAGTDYKVFFPLGYSVGPPGLRHQGVVPFYFRGPGYASAPPLLSGWRRHADGSDSLWITPLFHRTREPDGSLRHMHAAIYFQGRDYKVLFPLAYSVGEPGEKHRGLVPFFFKGPDYWSAPLTLSGRWKGADGSDSLWLTPLFHRTLEPDGSLRHMHAAIYFQGTDYKVLFPIAYSVGEPGEKHRGLVPVFFKGPDYWCVPPALSGRWKGADGSDSLWITPLFHRTREPDGSLRHMHAAIYFQGSDYKVLFPLAYSVGKPGRKHRGFVPFFFKGPGYWSAPPALSGWWREADGSDSLWITPLFHRTREPDGSLRNMHAATYFQGDDYTMLLPFFYHFGPSGRKQTGVLPFFFKGPDYTFIPPLMYGRLAHRDGTESLWVTPFFHRRLGKDGTVKDWHLLTYFEGPRYKLLLPFFYSAGEPGLEHWGVIPFFFKGPGYWRVPLLLSGGNTGPDGSDTIMITPLYYRKLDADGTLRYRMLAPFYFNWREGDASRTVVPPIYWENRRPGGRLEASALLGLVHYRRGETLDVPQEALAQTYVHPFVFLRAGADYDFRFLWALVHARREGSVTKASMLEGLLWFYERPGPGVPARAGILGGFFQRTVDYVKGTYSYRVFWKIPVRRGTFHPRL